MNCLGRTIKRSQTEITDAELETIVESCSAIPDYSVVISLPSQDEIPQLLNRLYEFVENSDATATEVMSYHKDRISFKNKSYIQVETNVYMSVD